LSMLKYLLGGYIANASRAWLSLRVFEGSPAVFSENTCKNVKNTLPKPISMAEFSFVFVYSVRVVQAAGCGGEITW
jgi:hypothetical protein